jgi:hypothetical protein
VGDAWELLVAPTRMAALDSLAQEAGVALDEITRSDTPTTADDAEFHFSDDLWAGIIYDLALAARGDTMDMDRMIAALVPIYFGRVASLVIEARDMTAQQTESIVERQARSFEQAKASFVERWDAGDGLKARKPKRPASPKATAKVKSAGSTKASPKAKPSKSTKSAAKTSAKRSSAKGKKA